jgi:site-specific recombinase XerD
MASIYKRGDIWHIDYVNLRGKRIRRSLGVKDKRLAEIKLKEIELQLAKGKLGYAIDKYLEDFIEEYLNWSENTKAKNTYLTDKKSLNSFKEYFGNVKLSQINMLTLEAWKVWLVETKKLSKTTANIRIRHIKSALSKAVEWNYLEENPAKNLKQYKVPKEKPKFLTEKEIKKVFSCIKNKTHLAVFNLLYLTGMRLSEALNLEWEDINFDEGFLVVRNKKDFHTKNYKERHIPIHPKLNEYLEHLKIISKEKVVPYSNNTIWSLFQKYSKKSGIKVTPHMLRHSFATHLVNKGVSLQVIKEILGHSDYSTTLIYAKVIDEYKRKALEEIGF